MNKHFLALNQFTKQELDALFDLTRELKEKQKNGDRASPARRERPWR